MISKRLSDRVAIITASTKGIGYAIARRLGRDGAKVIISSRKESNVRNAVDQLKSEGIIADGCVAHVGIDDDRQKLIQFAIDRYRKIDILVSNAAVNPYVGDIIDITDSHWHKLFDVNVRSAFLLSKAAIAHLEATRNGNIVFVSSITAYTPIDGIGLYGVTKASLIALSKAMSQSLAHRHIRVNAIAPGIIRTDFSRALWTSDSSSSSHPSIPMGRFGEPDDCAGIVSLLVSDESSYITGETVTISGGMNARM